ncbi:hypothetical protein [Haloplanus salilacus]|uniref:hypothetical protein n=1 Tax=Haloplanus salilacus TaxID=2949994 RepID=UPI0030D14EF8
MAPFDVECPWCGHKNQVALPKGTEPVEVKRDGITSIFNRSQRESFWCNNHDECGGKVNVYYE